MKQGRLKINTIITKEENMAYLTYRLVQISSAAIKAADVYYHNAVGLKIRELRVLRLLHDMPGSTPTELLENLELDKTLLSKNLAALEQRGLITRTVDERDNRRQCLHLSKRGEEAWLVAETIGHNLEKDMFADLSDEEWTQLQNLLERALESFNKWQKSHS